MASKKKELTFEEWYEDYRDAFVEALQCNYSLASMVLNVDIARRHWRRGTTPKRAAQEDADFIADGVRQGR